MPKPNLAPFALALAFLLLLTLPAVAAEDIDIGSMLPRSTEGDTAPAQPAATSEAAPKAAPEAVPAAKPVAAQAPKPAPSPAKDAPPLAGITDFDEFHKKFMRLPKEKQFLHCALPYSIVTDTMKATSDDIVSTTKKYATLAAIKKQREKFPMYPTEMGYGEYRIRIGSAGPNSVETRYCAETHCAQFFFFELRGDTWMLVSETIDNTGI